MLLLQKADWKHAQCISDNEVWNQCNYTQRDDYSCNLYFTKFKIRAHSSLMGWLKLDSEDQTVAQLQPYSLRTYRRLYHIMFVKPSESQMLQGHPSESLKRWETGIPPHPMAIATGGWEKPSSAWSDSISLSPPHLALGEVDGLCLTLLLLFDGLKLKREINRNLLIQLAYLVYG